MILLLTSLLAVTAFGRSESGLETEVGGCSSSNWCSTRCISHGSTDANGPYGCDCSACSSEEEAVGETCACSGGNQKGTENGDLVCQWRGGNCSQFRKGCEKHGATVCTMQKNAEKAVGDMSGSDEGWGRYHYGNFAQYGYRPDSAEKAVGDMSGSEDNYLNRGWGRYYNWKPDSAEKATGDASSDQIRAYNYGTYFNNRGWYDSAEKAVGDGYYPSSASSDQRRYGIYNYGYHGYGSSEKAVGDGYYGSSASSDQRRYGYYNYGYHGYGSSDKAASIFAVSMDSPATSLRNIMALLGLVAVVYGASMHYCVRKGEAVVTEF